jgi:hypothetical protein
MDIDTIAKKERDSILLYLHENWHNEKERADYILDTLIVMYKMGYKQALIDKNNINNTLEDIEGIEDI